MTDTIYHSSDVTVFRPSIFVEPARCRSGVWPDHGSLYQCGNQAKYHRIVEGYNNPLGFCGTHDPKRVRERRAKIDAEKELRRAKKCVEKVAIQRLDAMKVKALEAIREIANGYTDPQALAKRILEMSEA